MSPDPAKSDALRVGASDVKVETANVQYESVGSMQDDIVLARFGKRSQLKRRFGTISTIALTCNLMLTWESTLFLMGQGLHNGGPLGLITGFIFAWVGVMSQALVMAEMGSMIPVAGGQYNWVAVLAPPEYARFLSYATGWITTIAWQTNVASVTYLAGSFIQGLAQLNHPSYAPTRWQTTLIFYAVIVLCLCVNVFLIRLLPLVETTQGVITAGGFFAFVVVLACMGEKRTASEVFQVFVNDGDWSSRGLTFFVGLNNTMLIFLGIDGVTHLAEEIEDAPRVIPWAMVIGAIVAGVTGLAMLIVALFSIVDLDAVLNTPTGYPMMELIREAVGTISGASGMIAIIALVLILTAIGVTAATSRMLWAFSREQAVPSHQHLSKVSKTFSVPVNSICVTVVINMLLALINIGSTVAFYAFTSITVAAFYIVFMISTTCLLWRKLTQQSLEYGPFRLGRFGIPIGVFAIAYSLIGAVFSFFPQTVWPTLQEMNWASVMFVGMLALGIVYWYGWARQVYVGPLKETSIEEVEAQALRVDSTSSHA